MSCQTLGKVGTLLAFILGETPEKIRNKEEKKEMNLLMTLTEALQSTGDLDRDSRAILGLCDTSPKTGHTRFDPTYSAYLRRRDRIRRAA